MSNQDELDLLLVAAIRTNNVALVKKVIDQGANVNRSEAWFLDGLPGVNDFFPLDHAFCVYPLIENEIITILLDAGSNPNSNPDIMNIILHMYRGSDYNDLCYHNHYYLDNQINKRQFKFLLTSLLNAGFIAKSLAELMLEKSRGLAVYKNEFIFFKEMMFLVLLHGSYMPDNPYKCQYAPGEDSGGLTKLWNKIECWPLFMLLYCLNYKNMHCFI